MQNFPKVDWYSGFVRLALADLLCESLDRGVGGMGWLRIPGAQILDTFIHFSDHFNDFLKIQTFFFLILGALATWTPKIGFYL